MLPFPPQCINYELFAFGGGTYNTGTLTINRTTIAANEASEIEAVGGGGVDNLGKLTINASTLSANEAPVRGTCSACTSEGGGIDNAVSGTVEINNSTLAGNYTFLGQAYKLEGGGIVSSGVLLIHSSTVSGNLGGILGAATLQNSIVANNGSEAIATGQ